MSTSIKVWEYQGRPVHARPDEKVNLTDMWKAAGADPNKRPAEWLRRESTVEFSAALETMGLAHTLTDVEPGNPRTGKPPTSWAHWHLALAYARYLSPTFHVWCNDVIRGEMQRAPAEPIARLDASVVNSARIGNDETAKRALRRGITRVRRARGYSAQRVIGYLRKAYCVSSPFAVSLHLLDKVLAGLEEIEEGLVSLLSRREQRRIEARRRAADKQLPLALKGLN
jgi:hypothetical protein